MLKVIIADDEPKVCQLIQNLVCWQDFDMEVVGVAHSGVEALELIRSLNPELVITDIRMPGCDGIELIRRGKELNQRIDFIIISGYRHFDYAQSAIRYGVSDYLLKPIKKNELEATLTKMRQRYKEQQGQLSEEEALRHRRKSDIERLRLSLFNDLIFTQHDDRSRYALGRVNSEYHYSFAEGYFQVIAIKPDVGYKASFETSGKYLCEKIRQLVAAHLKPLCFDAQLYFSGSDAYCLLNFSPENKDRLRKQYKALLGEILVQSSLYEHLEITIGLGEAVDSLAAAPASYAAAAAAVQQRLVEGTGKVIERVPHTDGSVVGGLLSAERTKKLATAIELLDRKAAAEVVEDLKAATKGIAAFGGQGILALVCDFFQLFLYQLRSKEFLVTNERELLADFTTRAGQCSSLDTLFEYLALTIDEILAKIIDEKMQADTRPIRQAKQYIQENYMQPLTLEEVSSLVGFNTTYFSTLFKKETGISFLEYLTEVRMERAKELLRETRMSIAEICTAVGYSDLKHFTKRFIGHTGVKPTEYRRLYS